MNKANRKIVNNEKQAKSLGNEQARYFGVEWASPRASRWYFTGKAVGIVAGIAYGALYRARGRLADAVAAHAATNATLVAVAWATGTCTGPSAPPMTGRPAQGLLRKTGRLPDSPAALQWGLRGKNHGASRSTRRTVSASGLNELGGAAGTGRW